MKRILEIVLVYIPAIFLVISLTWVLAYKWLPVKWTPLMLKRTIENIGTRDYENRQVWVGKNDVDPILIEAIILAEDQRFYCHNGFDLTELKKVKEDYDHYGQRMRGCSTISQQVAKNCFTFGSRTIFRKVIEAYYTVLIEFIWGKERILEVYLNIVETGKGIYGVEAACQRYFLSSSEKVYIDDAVALVSTFPKPLARTPHSVRTTHAGKIRKLTQQLIESLANTSINTSKHGN